MLGLIGLLQVGDHLCEVLVAGQVDVLERILGHLVLVERVVQELGQLGIGSPGGAWVTGGPIDTDSSPIGCDVTPDSPVASVGMTNLRLGLRRGYPAGRVTAGFGARCQRL